ncbi:hypothetical protein DN069_26595 [Streptacidiphilus pinicola]|uniref:Uncharacterized protein n=1 Tax=Streptacidiphilus pinicola TaxID=2219663 RepID=A0A2X0K0A8_9ACTN|nr:hypothetical protein [Streptacidiphilus pinicola]RAG82685.1 hypothetical protein DN069_26595 [Streptacidiphilus pinicola]
MSINLTREQIAALPAADQIQIHDLYDAAAQDDGVRFEDSQFSALAHRCESCCGQSTPSTADR